MCACVHVCTCVYVLKSVRWWDKAHFLFSSNLEEGSSLEIDVSGLLFSLHKRKAIFRHFWLIKRGQSVFSCTAPRSPTLCRMNICTTSAGALFCIPDRTHPPVHRHYNLQAKAGPESWALVSPWLRVSPWLLVCLALDCLLVTSPAGFVWSACRPSSGRPAFTVRWQFKKKLTLASWKDCPVSFPLEAWAEIVQSIYNHWLVSVLLKTMATFMNV